MSPTHSTGKSAGGTQAAEPTALSSFLSESGSAEYQRYKDNSANARLTYHEWSVSEHALGVLLYKLSREAFDAASSDDDTDDDATEYPIEITSASRKGRKPGKAAKAKAVNKKSGLRNSFVADDGVAEVATSSIAHQKRKKSRVSEPILGTEISQASPVKNAIDNPAEAVPAAPKIRRGPGRPKKNSLPASFAITENAEATPAPTVKPSTVVAESPDNKSPSSARRRLRTRTAAQQRPYLHSAKLFDEVIDESGDEHARKSRSPHKSKLAEVSYAEEGKTYEDKDAMNPAESQDHMAASEKKAKGKGRTQKRDEKDVDAQLPQASTPPVKRKRGRPRKSEVMARQEQAEKAASPKADVSVTKLTLQFKMPKQKKDEEPAPVEASTPEETRRRRKPSLRKSHLSEEFVRDETDSDDAQENIQEGTSLKNDAPPPAKKQKRKYTRKPKPVEEPVSENIIDDDAAMHSEKAKRRAKKPYLSQEYVVEDSSSVEELPEEIQQAVEYQQQTSKPRKKQKANDKTISSPKRKRKSIKALSAEFVHSTDSEHEEGPQADVHQEPIVTPAPAPAPKPNSKHKRVSVSFAEAAQSNEAAKNGTERTPKRQPKKTAKAAAIEAQRIEDSHSASRTEEDNGVDSDGGNYGTAPATKKSRTKRGKKKATGRGSLGGGHEEPSDDEDSDADDTGYGETGTPKETPKGQGAAKPKKGSRTAQRASGLEDDGTISPNSVQSDEHNSSAVNSTHNTGRGPDSPSVNKRDKQSDDRYGDDTIPFYAQFPPVWLWPERRNSETDEEYRRRAYIQGI
ncbi:hypothetical protein M011DRAFT_482487 [Sporormia fimetaria CBS 119925]|uniref:Uncharacterized protein n=1 Tax=Sporormia fimetaria CBS 119925 TaxID=1340428 RepID=A0A6A6VM90_9PLEO|nr:hypothetical protein M011DRAFT_482487 [Sporormia fimetaria CBS 119925]